MNSQASRTWLVRWMYAAALAHLLVGILLPWIGNAAFLDAYHRVVETAFWGPSAPVAARTQQIWWMALFGPTVQALSLWMIVLIRIGDRHRSTFAWGALIAGMALWGPQDMLISLRADCWPHVWIDCFALATMLPPLGWLWWHDRLHASASPELHAASSLKATT